MVWSCLTRIWDPISEKDAGAHVHRRPRESFPSPKLTQKSPIGRTYTVYAHARRPSRACKTSTYTVSGASFGTHAACGHYTVSGTSCGTHAACGHIPSQARHVARTPRVGIYRLRHVMWHARRVWVYTVSVASCGTHAACGHIPSQSRHVAHTPRVVVFVFFTLTDRASTIPSDIRGCQFGTWSQRGTKVNGLHHGDNPLLRPTGIQITTKSYATLQAMAPTNNKTVHQTSFAPYREQPRSTRIVVAYPRPAFSATNRIYTFQPVLINNSKFLKATHRTKIRKIEIPRSMVVEGLSW